MSTHPKARNTGVTRAAVGAEVSGVSDGGNGIEGIDGIDSSIKYGWSQNGVNGGISQVMKGEWGEVLTWNG